MATVHIALQRRTLALLVVAYAAALLVPAPGVLIQRTTAFRWGGTASSVPLAILAFTLFSAGVSADWTGLVAVVRRPQALLVGLAANTVVPLVLLGCITMVTCRLSDFPVILTPLTGSTSTA